MKASSSSSTFTSKFSAVSPKISSVTGARTELRFLRLKPCKLGLQLTDPRGEPHVQRGELLVRKISLQAFPQSFEKEKVRVGENRMIVAVDVERYRVAAVTPGSIGSSKEVAGRIHRVFAARPTATTTSSIS